MSVVQIDGVLFEIAADGEYVDLDQDLGCGEMASIRLHRVCLAHIAERMGLLDADSGRCIADLEHRIELMSERIWGVADLQRRIAVLTDKLQDIACDRDVRSEILDRMGCGLEFLARLDALVDLALEFDGGRLVPRDHDEETTPPAVSKSGASIPKMVTPSNAVHAFAPVELKACPVGSTCGEQLGLEV